MIDEVTKEQEARQRRLQPYLDRVLQGETVTIGIFQIREDFIYARTKDEQGRPQFNRVLSLVYFDEAEDDQPATEEFDGTMTSFIACLNAHDAFDCMDEEELDEED